MNSHQIFTDLEHTLVCSEFLGKTAVGVRLFIIDEHNNRFLYNHEGYF